MNKYDSSHKARTYVLCALTIFSMAFQIHQVTAAAGTQILTSPEFLNVSVGQNLTLTYNLTNFGDLFGWQIVLKYNGSVINLTAIWIPTDNVFAGHNRIPIEPPTDTVAEGDSLDHMNWTMYGSALFGDDHVSVTDGILFSVNFTVIGIGQTTVHVATITSPVQRNRQQYYSELLDPNLNSFQMFDTTDCALVSGGGNAPPRAQFKVLAATVTNPSGHYIVDGNIPTGVENWVRAYKDYEILFDASTSNDPDGYITQYIWDFGDDNTTVVNVASPNDTSSAKIEHTYASTGPHYVSLFVFDNGDPSAQVPPASSPIAKIVVMVGIVLDLFDWRPFIYIVFGIIAAVIVVQAVRYGIRFRRNRMPKIQQPKTIVRQCG